MTNPSEHHGDDDQELRDLEATWALTSPLWRCAHCRHPITGPGYTWFGPLPRLGQDRDARARFHIARRDQAPVPA
ncbi:hypothetical protein ACEZDB_36110 [Streptacidiphilus sp. N1-3]|uniref:Uncharacterized protein n=1 Tax=Streptacidiphilus alkalitolerans TaxID=3342712 RepID=A0ABV6XCW0_9ACTN